MTNNAFQPSKEHLVQCVPFSVYTLPPSVILHFLVIMTSSLPNTRMLKQGQFLIQHHFTLIIYASILQQKPAHRFLDTGLLKN